MKQDIQWYEWPKIKNRNVLKAIMVSNRKRKVPIVYKWVEGHKLSPTEVEHVLNHKADKAARSKSTSYSISDVKEPWPFNDPFSLIIDDNVFDGNIRKELYRRFSETYIKDFTLTSSGERFREDDAWVVKDWDITFKNRLNYNVERFVFVAKAKGLMTHDRMRKYNEELYEGVMCPFCNNPENGDEHVFNVCIGYVQDRLRVWEDIVNAIAVGSRMDAGTVTREITRWIPITSTNGDHLEHIWFTTKLPRRLERVIRKWNSGEDAKELYIDIKEIIANGAYDMWLKRCDNNALKLLDYQSRIDALTDDLGFLVLEGEEEYQW
jgi:hypothetical protein